jgi:hypothetical protein
VSEHGRAWLAARSDAVPPALQDEMEAAASAVPATAPPDAPAELADAALACLRAAFDECDSRGAALHLLAADALVTGACEAAAEAGPEALERLCESLSPARLEPLLPAAGKGGPHD